MVHGLLAVAVAVVGLGVVAPAPSSAAPSITTFATAPDVDVNDVTFDPVSGLAYVVVPSRHGTFGNRLVAFDPSDGSVEGSVFVGSEPSHVSVSTDGSVIWVGLTGLGQVVQVRAADLTVLDSIDLQAGSGSPRYVQDLAPVPGDADAVVVSTRRLSGSPRHEGVVLVRDGEVAPNETSRHTGANVIEAVSASRVVGYTTETSGFAFWQLDIDDDGVTVAFSGATSIVGFGRDITYADGVVYSSGGVAIDAETRATIATYPTGTVGQPVVHDGRVYFLDSSGIRPFSVSTFAPDGVPVTFPGEHAGFELTDDGWLVWGEEDFDVAASFLTPTVAAEGPNRLGGGVRTMAATPQLAVVDAVYDEVDDLVYAVVSSADPTYPNRLVAFSPTTGAVADSVFVGSEPNLVELSTDRSTVWVALRGSNALAEIDRASMSVTATISFDEVDDRDPSRAISLAPVVGHADAVVVALDNPTSSGAYGVVLVDGGAIAPDHLTDIYGARSLAAVSPSRVVGYDPYTSGFGFYRIDVTGTGLASGGDVLRTAIRGYGVQIVVDGDEVYASNGTVIDAETGAGLGRHGSVSSRVPAVVDDGFVYLVDSLDDEIQIFDEATFVPQGMPVEFTDDIEGLLLTASGLVVWGGGEFLDGQVIIPVGALFGIVRDDQTAAPIPDLCIDAYRAGDLGYETVESTTSEDTGRWRMSVPAGDYWVYYYECEFFDYLSEWHGDALPFYPGSAEVITVRVANTVSLDASLTRMFTDVPRDAFYFSSSVFLWYSGITTGCGVWQYCPDADVTREQMAAFTARLWRMFASCPSGASPFDDVAATSFAYRDVGCIAWLGVTTGTGPDTYSPHDLVTREQMASFIARIWRAFGFSCPAGEMPFTDVPVTSFAYDDVICIFELGITTGTSATTYSPGDVVSRAQMAAFLERLFDAISERLDSLETSGFEAAFALTSR